jgi:cell volume regulation protein A
MVFDPKAVNNFAPYFAGLALAYILFDGGIGLNIRRVLSNSYKAGLLAVLGFVFSVGSITAFMVAVFDLPWLYGLLFGSICGGSSSVVVISLASKVKISEKGATILILESALTDIFCIVISLSIIDILVTGQADVVAIGAGITGKFLIGAGMGLIFGFMWLFALKRLAAVSFSYMLTLGAVLMAYALSELLGGSGALSVLLFGLVLGNERELLKFFKLNGNNNQTEKATFSVSKGLKRFEAEVAFLIRTFFFVFLGIIASISDLTVLMAGITISIILLAVRFGAVWLTTAKSNLKKDREIMTAILTRGLAAAVLATLPAQYGLLYADLFVNIALIVIVTTAIIATVGAIVISRKNRPAKPA